MDVGNGTLHFFFQEKHKNLSPHFIIMETLKKWSSKVEDRGCDIPRDSRSRGNDKRRQGVLQI